MSDRPTIFALSSGSGRAGIAVIRISGPLANTAVLRLAGALPKARTAVLRDLVDEGEIIDQAMVLWFAGPHSATGEDVAEFHVHGSSAVVARVLRCLSKMPGLRAAEAGEFTRQAFANRKMDLVEIEGLSDLLAADSEMQRRVAMRQFLGSTSAVFESWREQIISVLAHIEAAIDFSDEDNSVAEVWSRRQEKIRSLIGVLQDALAKSAGAHVLRTGVRIVIAGAPNVGKSTLLNWLARRDAAIVSSTAGTTRDVVEAGLRIGGFDVVVADTAGLRSFSDDDIEKIGMARSAVEIAAADVLVWVRSPDRVEEVGPPREPDLFVITKSDLESPHPIRTRNDGVLDVSFVNGQGLPKLLTALEDVVRRKTSGMEHAVLVRLRHTEAVTQSIRFLNEALNRGADHPELLAEHLRSASRAMASLTGHVDVEDLLGKIFSEFCIGK